MLPFDSERFTHVEIVEIARDWLVKRGCSVVVSEIASHASEQPDAIGWQGSESTLIECKASRTDFLADRKKYFREYLEMGMGDWRYFMTNAGVIKDKTELPANFGWLEVNPLTGKVTTRKKAEKQSIKNAAGETLVLLSLIRRIGQTAPEGVSIRCYTNQNKCRPVVEIQTDAKIKVEKGFS